MNIFPLINEIPLHQRREKEMQMARDLQIGLDDQIREKKMQRQKELENSELEKE